MVLNKWIKFVAIYLLFEVLIAVVSYDLDGVILSIIIKATSAYGIVILIDNHLRQRYGK